LETKSTPSFADRWDQSFAALQFLGLTFRFASLPQVPSAASLRSVPLGFSLAGVTAGPPLRAHHALSQRFQLIGQRTATVNNASDNDMSGF
jgi:hypothetical protein